MPDFRNLQAGIHFRREILNSWLIADWAADNRAPAALATAIINACRKHTIVQIEG